MHSFSFYRIFTGFHTGARVYLAYVSTLKSPRFRDTCGCGEANVNFSWLATTGDNLPSTHEMMTSLKYAYGMLSQNSIDFPALRVKSSSYNNTWTCYNAIMHQCVKICSRLLCCIYCIFAGNDDAESRLNHPIELNVDEMVRYTCKWRCEFCYLFPVLVRELCPFINIKFTWSCLREWLLHLSCKYYSIIIC
jgi:hypothetical protein